MPFHATGERRAHDPFDHLIGPLHQRGRDREAEGLRGLEVDGRRLVGSFEDNLRRTASGGPDRVGQLQFFSHDREEAFLIGFIPIWERTAHDMNVDREMAGSVKNAMPLGSFPNV